ncbi:MAG TPA: hypothetical protein VFG08_07375 [Candidatus Polarisedimenticolia bacterium]|nr:hypothetical protein [Candidatus Polarisedimenticolia bacterium]
MALAPFFAYAAHMRSQYQSMFGDSIEPAPAPVPQRVVVHSVEMPFWSMVRFMVKWTLATIPALLVLGVLALGAALLAMAVGNYLGIAPQF